MNTDDISAVLNEILGSVFTLPNVKTSESYNVEGDNNGQLSLMLGPDGDIIISINNGKSKQTLRFRYPGSGGGQHPRVRNALLILLHTIAGERSE